MSIPRSALPRSGGPRLSDVAALAGVSPATVSHVLNHPHKVRPETQARVLAAIDELGFARNQMASALARGDSLTVGLVVPSLGNSLFVDASRGAQAVVREAGYYLNLATADDDERLFSAHMRRMNEVRASGMLIAPLSAHLSRMNESRRAGCPVVVLNHDDGRSDSCHVLVDNDEVGALAVDHMAGLGKRRIWFVHAEDHRQPVSLRLAGARRAAAAIPRGATFTAVETETIWAPSGAEVARRVAALPAARRPDAIIGVTDGLALGLIEGLIDAGLDVPDDIAVMGCDHNTSDWGSPVPLTSVSMEGEQMGREAARLLLEELQHADTHRHTTVMLQPHVVPRVSTVGRRPRAVDRTA